MEKETYISDIRKLIHSNKDLKEKLTTVSLILYNNGYGVDFCKIFGARWSYFAGYKENVCLTRKTQLTNEWGVLSDKKLPTNLILLLTELVSSD